MLKLHDKLKSNFFLYLFKFSSIGFPELACGQFNPVHGVHTRDTSKNSLILIPRMLASQYCNNSLRRDRASL